MKTIAQYRDDIQALMKKSADLDAQATAQSRDLTEAELALKGDILDRVDEIKNIVDTLERQDRLNSSLNATPAPASAPRPSRVEVGIDNRSRESFGSFGQQLAAVMNAGMGNGTDPRLFNAASGLNENSGPDGGFLVQTDFASTLLNDVFETGILASRCRELNISAASNRMTMNGVDETSRASSRSGGIIGYWEEEAAEKTATKPKFRKIDLKLKKLIGLCYATDELLEDATALESVITTGFVDEFGFLVDDSSVNGTGAGQPLGILNSGCLVTVAKETGQATKTIMAENVMNMYSRMFARSRSNGVWLINQDIEPQLFGMSLAVGTGGVPVYMPAGGLAGQPFATLFGRPVLAIEQCPTLGTLGDIIFADLNGYLLAKKGGVKADMSIHVRFVYDESVFRFTMRVDGQPLRASALTPYKGTNTLSHFVALAAR
jgi:HK97 family phage major capsid protein